MRAHSELRRKKTIAKIYTFKNLFFLKTNSYFIDMELNRDFQDGNSEGPAVS